jgi:polyhydroxyalkanoate synthesis repressor PhaR
MAHKEDRKPTPITIKKYANRRLYNTATSSYVTLDHLSRMVKDDADFIVYDAKSGEDITRTVLTQIIVEEEAKGQNLLPINFLRQLIGLYGDGLQWMVPRYLEHAMTSFARNKEQMRDYFQSTLSDLLPVGQADPSGDRAAVMLAEAVEACAGAPGSVPAGSAAPQRPVAELDDLRRKLDDLQRQVASMTRAARGM